MHREQSSVQLAAAPVPGPAGKRVWQSPVLTPLPRLVKLTLQTGGAGGAVGGAVGGTGGTGGFGF